MIYKVFLHKQSLIKCAASIFSGFGLCHIVCKKLHLGLSKQNDFCDEIISDLLIF